MTLVVQDMKRKRDDERMRAKVRVKYNWMVRNKDRSLCLYVCVCRTLNCGENYQFFSMIEATTLTHIASHKAFVANTN